jgi:hypothetical protein
MEKDNNRIAIVLGSRGRPRRLEAFVRSLNELADDPNSYSVYIYVDSDDEATILYSKELKEKYDQLVFHVGPRIIMSDMINKLYPYTSEGIIFLGGDDLIMRTQGWDSIIAEAYAKCEDRILLCYGADGGESVHTQSNFATHPIISRRWVEIQGCITPPYFSCDYADTWLNDLANELGRKKKLPIYNEHMHWSLGKSSLDMTYVENRQRFEKDNVIEKYAEVAHEREAVFNKLKEALIC